MTTSEDDTVALKYICRCYSDGEVVIERRHKEKEEEQKLCTTTSPVTKSCFVRGSSGTTFLFLVSGLTVIIAREIKGGTEGNLFFGTNLTTLKIEDEALVSSAACGSSESVQKPCHVTCVSGCSMLLKSSNAPVVLMLIGHYNGCLTMVVIDERRFGVPVLLPWRAVHDGLNLGMIPLANQGGIIDISLQNPRNNPQDIRCAISAGSSVYACGQVCIDASGGHMQISSSPPHLVSTMEGIRRTLLVPGNPSDKLSFKLLLCGQGGMRLLALHSECSIRVVGHINILTQGPKSAPRYVLQAIAVPMEVNDGEDSRQTSLRGSILHCADSSGRIYSCQLDTDTLLALYSPETHKDMNAIEREEAEHKGTSSSKRRRLNNTPHSAATAPRVHQSTIYAKRTRQYRLASFPTGCCYDDVNDTVCFLDYCNCVVIV